MSESTGVPRKNNVKEKINTQARIEKYFEKEHCDPNGFECKVRQETQGRADIHLDKLSVNPEEGLPIDEKRVAVLAKDILFRPDPTQFMLTVVPDDVNTFNIELVQESSYTVVHGRHRSDSLMY